MNERVKWTKRSKAFFYVPLMPTWQPSSRLRVAWWCAGNQLMGWGEKEGWERQEGGEGKEDRGGKKGTDRTNNWGEAMVKWKHANYSPYIRSNRSRLDDFQCLSHVKFFHSLYSSCCIKSVIPIDSGNLRYRTTPQMITEGVWIRYYIFTQMSSFLNLPLNLPEKPLGLISELKCTHLVYI